MHWMSTLTSFARGLREEILDVGPHVMLERVARGLGERIESAIVVGHLGLVDRDVHRL